MALSAEGNFTVPTRLRFDSKYDHHVQPGYKARLSRPAGTGTQTVELLSHFAPSAIIFYLLPPALLISLFSFPLTLVALRTTIAA